MMKTIKCKVKFSETGCLGGMFFPLGRRFLVLYQGGASLGSVSRLWSPGTSCSQSACVSSEMRARKCVIG